MRSQRHLLNRLRLFRFVAGLFLLILVLGYSGNAEAQTTINFGSSVLSGPDARLRTDIQFGPDGRLYLLEQVGVIDIYNITRNGPNDYTGTRQWRLDVIELMTNHNDDGSLASTVKGRQATGMLLTGTAEQPVIYVTSSDKRNGGEGMGDVNLDTNSGVLSRLTLVNNQWVKEDLVRGLPRSEELHSTNDMWLDEATNILYIGQGGHTNAGATSNGFAHLPEFALSAALLRVDLNALGTLPYDLPTLNDPSRADVPNSVSPQNPYGLDVGDPFGGNDGNNQAILFPGGPVQLEAVGLRNPYGVVKTTDGHLYVTDNGPNPGFGGLAVGVNTPNCTSAENEANIGTTYDQLHLVTPGFFGGHPNPTRANINNTFNGVSPVALVGANPIECNYYSPGDGGNPPQDGALATFPGSTNGIVEYTASNFGGAMQGDLLLASFTSTIYRVQLSPDGTQAANVATFAANVGSGTLNLTVQDDNQVFPGTVWAVNIFSGTVVVFEPADYDGGTVGECTGANDPNLDEDTDGYTNADEIANGTDPCSAAIKPTDADGDFISDLLDPDDDNDSIPDTQDFFAVDAANGLNTQLPLYYSWNAGDPGFGLFGLGFTGAMNNGVDDYSFDEENFIYNNAAGNFTIVQTSLGTALNSSNNQQDAFQFGVHVDQSTGPFMARTQFTAPYFDNQPLAGQSAGMFVGTGDQDNYVALVVTPTGLSVIVEVNGVATVSDYPVSGLLTKDNIGLSLTVDPVAGTILPRYTPFTGAPTALGTPIALSGALLDAVRNPGVAVAVGVIASAGSSGTPFAASWEFFEVKLVSPNVLAALPSSVDVGTLAPSATADVPVTLRNEGVGGDPAITISALLIADPTYVSILDAPLLPFTLQPGEEAIVQVRFAITDPVDVSTSLDVTHTGSNSPLSVPLAGSGSQLGDALFRVNAGGPAINPGSANEWSQDLNWHWISSQSNSSPYANVGETNDWRYSFSTGGAHPGPIDMSHPSLPAGTPVELFEDERFDQPNGAEMRWSFPVSDGPYEVRLYFAEIAGGITGPGKRVFDVEVEGALVLDNYDQWVAAGGPSRGVMESILTFVSDGELTIDFRHVVDNPGVKGIEVLPYLGSLDNLLQWSPESLSFGDVTVGQPAVLPVTLTNAASSVDPITINGLSISGPDAAAYAVASPGVTVLQPGESVVVDVTFTPQAEGSATAVLDVDHTGVNAPAAISLSGTGTPPVTTESQLSTTPNSLDFGSVEVGSTATLGLTLANSGAVGSESITVSQLDLTGASFSILNGPALPLTLAPGESAALDVVFAPQSAGTASGSLHVVHTATNDVTVPLSGNGFQASSAVYRVNAGGPGLNAGTENAWDGDSNWHWNSSMNQSSPYANVAAIGDYRYSITSWGAFTGPMDLSHPSIPPGTPPELFETQRWDPGATPEMNWAFPVANGTYEVRLYFNELAEGIKTAGQRVFDVSVEGSVVPSFNNIDPLGEAGSKGRAIMRSAVVTVTDGTLNLEFLHIIDNPDVNAIEILSASGGSGNLTVTPSALNFGTVVRDLSSAPQSVTLTNNSGQDVTIDSITLAGAAPDQFALTLPSLPLVLTPGTGTTVDVQFAPTVLGQQTASLEIQHSAGSASVALSGEGVYSRLELSSLNLAFGQQEVGSTSAPQTVTFMNISPAGSPSITVSGASITGTHAADFALAPFTPVVLAPGENASISVTFTPSAQGARSASVTLTSDAGNPSGTVIAVNGTGVTTGSSTALYRVNAGGPALSEGTPDAWGRDQNWHWVAAQSLSSPYANVAAIGDYRYSFASWGSYNGPIDLTHASIPAGTPAQLFESQRWDPAGSPEMLWSFPVDPGSYEVRLYFTELAEGIKQPGQRVFDVVIEGSVPESMSGIDPLGEAGAKGRAVMHSAVVTVEDGTLNLEFVHVVDNPFVSAIEILPSGGTSPSGSLTSDVSTVDFGSVVVGQQSAAQLVTVTNPSSVPVTVSDVSVAGLDSAHFTIVSGPTIGTVIAAGESADISLMFAPQAVGPWSAMLELTHDGTNSPLQVVLTGTGTDGAAPTLSAAPQSVDFGSVIVGQSAGSSVVLTHDGVSGSAPIVVSALSTTQTGPFTFASAQPLPVTLNAGESLSVALLFAPTASGAASDTLTVTHDGSNTPLTVLLSGQGFSDSEPTDALFRVNAGGPALNAGAPGEWSRDLDWHWIPEQSLSSPYANVAETSDWRYTTTSWDAYGEPVDVSHPSIPAGTPAQLFSSQRTDRSDGADLLWSFPVQDGGYEVRLYFAELSNSVTGPGQRVFDVALEGVVYPRLDNFDVFAAAGGANRGVMVAMPVFVNDGVLNIGFGYGAKDPIINGIEILPLTTLADTLAISPTDLDLGSVSVGQTGVAQAVTLSNVGSSTALTVTGLTLSDSTNFALANAPALPLTLQPGQSTDVSVVFTPTVSGTSSTQLSVQHSGVNSPVSMVLTGRGLATSGQAAQGQLAIVPPGDMQSASTSYPSSFVVTNNSTQGEMIERIRIDVSSAMFPDIIYDPYGTGGDVVGLDLVIDAGQAETGYASHSYFGERDGGFTGMEIVFSDFAPGETFTFHVDLDPLSLKGVSAPGPMESGGISGIEMIGSRVTFDFTDGYSYESAVFRKGSTLTAGQALLEAETPVAPTIEVLGIGTGPAGVSQSNQTVRVYSPAGTNVSLLVLEGALYLDGVPNGGYDIDPYEANSVIAIREYNGTMGGSGYVDLNVTLSNSRAEGGINYLGAVVRQANGRTSLLSNVIALELGTGAQANSLMLDPMADMLLESTPTLTPTGETGQPVEATEEPTMPATITPAPGVTEEPTVPPTATEPQEPTAVPTLEPTATLTPEPTALPTSTPSPEPTAVPTNTPTVEPTAVPTEEPPTEPPLEQSSSQPEPGEVKAEEGA